jgi:hypothetical protein
MMMEVHMGNDNNYINVVASSHRVVFSSHRRIVASSHGHRQQRSTLRRQPMRMNSRIANQGTKMLPLENDKSSSFLSLFAA